MIKSIPPRPMPLIDTLTQFHHNVEHENPIPFSQMSAVVSLMTTEDGVKANSKNIAVKKYAELLGIHPQSIEVNSRYIAEFSKYLQTMMTHMTRQVGHARANVDHIASRFQVSPETVLTALTRIERCFCFSAYRKKECPKDDTTIVVQNKLRDHHALVFKGALDQVDGKSGGFSRVRGLVDTRYKRPQVLKKIVHERRREWLIALKKGEKRFTENPFDELLCHMLIQSKQSFDTVALHPEHPMVIYLSGKTGEFAICRVGLVMEKIDQAADRWVTSHSDLYDFTSALACVYTAGMGILNGLPVQHGDFKIENLMRTSLGIVKLIDCGATSVLTPARVTKHPTNPFFTSLTGTATTKANAKLEDQWGLVLSCLDRIAQFHLLYNTSRKAAFVPLYTKMQAFRSWQDQLSLTHLVLELQNFKKDNFKKPLIPPFIWGGIDDCIRGHFHGPLESLRCA